MPLPFPRPVNAAQMYVSGDVTIDPSAALAPGVILRAAANSQIRIGSGVCLGMGVVLNAYQGTIVIENGVSLGPGVLIVGASTIGHHACIGAVTTIFKTSVDPHQVIPSGSILGDPTRQADVSVIEETTDPTISDQTRTVIDLERNGSAEGQTDRESGSPESVEATPTEPESQNVRKPKDGPVFGQTYVNQLLVTIFPDRE